MKKPMLRLLAVLFVFSMSAEVFAIESGRASGKMIVNGKARTMKFAYAKKTKNSEGQVEYHVVVTDRAVFPTVFRSDWDMGEAIKASGGGMVKLTFMPDKSLQQAYSSDPNMTKSGGVPMSGSEIDATLSALSSSAIAGTAKSSEPSEFFDNVVSIDVAFAASVDDEKFGANAAAIKELEPKFAKIADGTATGSITVAGTKTPLTHVYALRIPGWGDDTKRDTLLVFSDKPIEDKVLADERKLEENGSRGKFQGVLVRINDENEPFVADVLHYEGQTKTLGTSNMGYEALDLAKGTVGRIYTREPQQLQGKKTYEFDLSYRATVRTLEPPREEGLVDAKNGTKLPAGGGEPGKAYLAFAKAISTGNINELKKFQPADGGGMPPLDPKDKETKELLELLKMMQPTNLKIVDGYIAGDLATLTVTGSEPSAPKSKSTGTVFLKKEEGRWRMGKQNWSTKSE